ncbi:MAG: O-antigen ligase family protein [Limnothrix sp. RL_2_0]|nr:O-antigen ligase family protein [Limnothrix sp. RL_2_0]
MATKGKKILSVLAMDPWIIALIMLSGLSYFWSVAPAITFASFRSLIVQYVLAGYLVTTYSCRQIITFTSRVLCATGILSLLYLFFLPHVAIRNADGHLGGSWRGIFLHQSVLAGTMALAIISLVYSYLLQPQRHQHISKLAAALVFGICFYLLIFCGAKTAVIAFLASFSIVPFFFLQKIRGMKTRNIVFVGLIYLFIIGIPLLYSMQELIVVELLGKSPTLSGRSYLWDYLFSKILENPFGYGLNAFWQNSELVRESVLRTGGYSYGNSHSNYFDLLLGIGFPGAALLAVCLVTVISRTVTLAFKHQRLEFRWALQILICLLIASYSDVFIGFLASRTVGWFLFCIISLTSSIELKRIQAQNARPTFGADAYTLKTRHSGTYG